MLFLCGMCLDFKHLKVGSVSKEMSHKFRNSD